MTFELIVSGAPRTYFAGISRGYIYHMERWHTPSKQVLFAAHWDKMRFGVLYHNKWHN